MMKKAILADLLGQFIIKMTSLQDNKSQNSSRLFPFTYFNESTSCLMNRKCKILKPDRCGSRELIQG